MAISPSEAEGFTSQQETLLADAERQIDAYLRGRYQKGERVWVGAPLGFTRVMVDTLMERYRKVGWKVEYVYDQRDGDALVFG